MVNSLPRNTLKTIACNFRGHLLVVGPRSELLALVPNLQSELPALTGKHHAAEFLPGDFSTIDDEERCAITRGTVRPNPALHDQVISDLQPRSEEHTSELQS